jgi:hypothetical protein
MKQSLKYQVFSFKRETEDLETEEGRKEAAYSRQGPFSERSVAIESGKGVNFLTQEQALGRM